MGTVLSSNATLTVRVSVVVQCANPDLHAIQSSTAKPYPSTILVTNANGILNKVTVALSNLTDGTNIIISWPATLSGQARDA